MNYIAKADICMSCNDDIKAGTLFDPEKIGIDYCTLLSLETAGVVCKEIPDQINQTLPEWPKTDCDLCDFVESIKEIANQIEISNSSISKNFALNGVYVTNLDSPFCGEPVILCDGKPSVIDPITFKIVELDTMTTTIGKNTAEKNCIIRQINLEVAADGADEVITNSDLLAMLAGGTFDNGMAADDAANVYIHSFQATLGHLGDEDGNGFVSNTCDAVVIDLDTKQTVNLEPGGEYSITKEPCSDIQGIELNVVTGSLVRICICVSLELAKNGDAIAKAGEKEG